MYKWFISIKKKAILIYPVIERQVLIVYLKM
jgi:hypothetical protein